MKQDYPVVISADSRGDIDIHLYSSIDNRYVEHNFSHLPKLPHLRGPIVFLTDFHHKPRLETPSSSVVITNGYLSFSLTSPSQNCGMSLIKTPFAKEEMSAQFIDNFMASITKLIPLKHDSPVITKAEVVQALKDGGQWAIDKYGLAAQTSQHMEYGGNLVEGTATFAEIQNAIPDEIIEYSRTRFCIIGGGNHFLELQVVDEILDEKIADLWGVKKNQVLIMFHTGSEALGAYLGRLYSYRKKTDLRHQFHFFLKKIKHHLLSGPWHKIPQRLSYYFPPVPFRFIDPVSDEGKRALLAINCSANFGFANRIAVFSAISQALQEAAGQKVNEVNLLYDCSHNSIYQETISGEKVWAHRHNACRVYPPSLLKDNPVFSKTGQPVILPGTNQTSSFICSGREGAVKTHFTVDHGLGAVQKNYMNSEEISPDKAGEQTLLYKYENSTPDKVPRMSDIAVQSAVEILNRSGIIRTVARLKPLATLKGPKSKIV